MVKKLSPSGAEVVFGGDFGASIIVPVHLHHGRGP